MRDYSTIASKLSIVRRAWKRTAALSGLAVVVLESAGVFTVALLGDILYEPLPVVRVGLLTVVLCAVAYLLARHVVAVGFRRIPDEQIALYVEEHSPEFEGALISAAEFGPQQVLAPEQERIIDAIILEAASRAERFDLRSAIDLARLRKYGVAAAVVLVSYVALGVVFPKIVGHHAERVLTPWRPTDEDRARLEHFEMMKQPITFKLSRKESRMLRGDSFELEATLSRPPEAPVVLQFRSLAPDGDDWRLLPMSEIEKVNTYWIVLADISEEMEFYVSSGGHRTPAYHLAVYDPLVLEGVEIVTHFPEYLNLEDRVETLANGDVAAPVGSKVTARILANRPLARGQIAWEDGTEQKLIVDMQEDSSAYAEFTIEDDTTYTYEVVDIDGQAGSSPGAAYVRALKDISPMLEVKYPKIDIVVHPLGEVTVEAEVADDFGIEVAELVYQRGTEPDAPEVRVPLKLQSPAGDEGKFRPGLMLATLRFAFEDLDPKVEPGDHFSYYLECRDRKDQKAISDVFFLNVTPFEVWSTWRPVPPEGGSHERLITDLRPFLAAAWHLHRQKDQLSAEEFDAQCEELSDSMTDPETGQLYSFVEMDKVPPEKIDHARRAVEFIEKGYYALLAYDTGTAIKVFRVALAELAIVGASDDSLLLATPEGLAGGPATAEEERSLAQIAFLEEAKTAGMGADSIMKVIVPDYRRELLEAEEAEKLQKKAEQLAQAQEQIIQEARDAARQEEARPEGEQKPETAQQLAQLAQRQEQVGERTREAADELRNHPAAADPRLQRMAAKVENAAREMHRAAREMRDEELDRAVASAQRAKQQLDEAKDQLKGIREEKLERALDLAEAQAERLLDEQRRVRRNTEDVARDLPRERRPSTRQDRDLRKMAHQQAGLRKQTETLQEHLDKLQEWSERTAKRETARHIKQAHSNARRSQIRQKMTNAILMLDSRKPETATEQQKKAEAGLERVLASVRDASDSLASDRESELRRATREARRIEDGLERLAPQRPGEKAEVAQKPEERPAEKGAEATPLNAQEREALGQHLQYEIRRFAQHLANRDLVKKTDVEHLKRTSQRPQALGARSVQEKEAKEVLSVVRRVRNKLEVELKSTLAAKKLFAAQREECPPQYRPLVNKYYEALANAGR